MHETGIHISLGAQKLFDFLSIPITNTIVSTALVSSTLIILAFVFKARLKEVPSRLQAIIEALFEYTLSYMEEVLENKRLARKLFPIIMTIFLFVLFANWMGHLPFYEAIAYEPSGAHFPKSSNTDLNTTLALAIISFFTVEIIGVASLGFFKYMGKFINFSSPLDFIIGLIELISELARLVAFSFRLFGNILAGEVLILVIKYFVPYLLPVPLLAFEFFVGFVQAAIFALLTLYFVKLAIMEPEHAH